MTSPRNILFVADGFAEGGAARVIYELILGLDKTKYTPELCCLDTVGTLGEDLRARGIPVHWLNRAPGTDWNAVRQIAELVRTRNIHLLHAHQYTAFFYGLLGASRAGLKKVVFTEHGRHYPDRKNLKRVIFNKIMCPRTSRIIAVSEAVRQSLITYECMPGSRIEIIINGIDGESFRQGMNIQQRRELRRELGVPNNDLLLGMIARLGPEKDHLTLMRALQKTVEKHPQTSLLIVGDGPLKEELLAWREKLGLKEKIFFTGVRHDVPRLLNLIDIVVLSSFYEGTSITLLEAMASGKPVLASRVGGNPYVVEDGVTGYLFADADELSRRIIDLASDKINFERMGQAGYERFATHFTRRHMVEHYEQIYREELS